MEFKLVIGDPKTKKSYQKVLADNDARFFVGKKIGDKFKGESIDMTGYEFEITGGSDFCGFPMRKDVPGQARKRILITKGTAFKKARKGERRRKTVAGSTIYDKTAQINLKVLQHGKKALEQAPTPSKEAKEEKKEEKKSEEKKETKKEEKPVEEEKKDE